MERSATAPLVFAGSFGGPGGTVTVAAGSRREVQTRSREHSIDRRPRADEYVAITEEAVARVRLVQNGIDFECDLRWIAFATEFPEFARASNLSLDSV
jgi:hypothetical protein